MKPTISIEIADFLATSRDDLFVLPSDGSGTCHVLFPDSVPKNIARFADTYQQHSLEPAIYYALKANKSSTLLRAAHTGTPHVEVSSLQELHQALAAGFIGTNIAASGPLKATTYLEQCVTHGVLVAIDDPSELEVLTSICKTLQTAARVLLRINTPGSRFGIPPGTIRSILSEHARYGSQLRFAGCSFHLNNYSVAERQDWLRTAIELVLLARRHGHDGFNTISIGGGFTVNYTDRATWQDWQQRTQANAIGSYDGGASLASGYPYYSPHAKEHFLGAVLGGSASGGKTLAERLRTEDIRLMIEPGRSLLDQAGITIFDVNGTKQHISDYPMVIVEGNINALSERWFGSDFLPDPLLLSWAGRQTAPAACYIGGNLCLENDMLATRPVPFDTLPARGDKLVFVNTAGYQMDSNESSFARLPIPRKFVAAKHNTVWRVHPDEEA